MNNFIEKLKSRSPLIHNITNMVTINDVANIELACGARPIMAMAPQEMDEVTGICDGLNLNIGTPSEERFEAMRIAARMAEKKNIPIVLDLVGVGVSRFRMELATADTADSGDYQAVLLQRGTADSYESFIEDSEADLKQAYGVIKPRKVNLTVEGAAVEAVRCDIRTYYAVLATITYDSGDVVYVSALTKLASISDVVNLVESVSLS